MAKYFLCDYCGKQARYRIDAKLTKEVNNYQRVNVGLGQWVRLFACGEHADNGNIVQRLFKKKNILEVERIQSGLIIIDSDG